MTSEAVWHECTRSGIGGLQGSEHRPVTAFKKCVPTRLAGASYKTSERAEASARCLRFSSVTLDAIALTIGSKACGCRRNAFVGTLSQNESYRAAPAKAPTSWSHRTTGIQPAAMAV